MNIWNKLSVLETCLETDHQDAVENILTARFGNLVAKLTGIIPNIIKLPPSEFVEVAGKQVRRKETKTGVDRWFSCPARLQELLKSIRPEAPSPDALVFISPKGSAIGESNFGDRAWKSILTKLELYMKDGIKMTPYNCRDTFITLQAVEGVSSTTIARWVGNSSKVIEEKYLDKLRLEHL